MLEKARLETLFPTYEKILVAVSGGCDSLALLLLLNEHLSKRLVAATVDHGLRPEAADEARFVASHCAKLNIPHKTLNWVPSKKNSHSARTARYALLADHAKTVGAKAIALGHTMNDQAETLIMRAARAKAHSGTRGMTGMTQTTAYDDLTLVRPMLGLKREDLRDFLTTQNVSWIDDPSNENTESERVRVRRFLECAQSDYSLHDVTHLANFSEKTRFWLSTQAAALIKSNVTYENQGFGLHIPLNSHRLIVREVFSTLIWVTGGLPYRPSLSKIHDVVKAAQDGHAIRKAVARCMINVKNREAQFTREDRRSKQERRLDTKLPQQAVNMGTINPLKPLEHFRPSTDDPVYEALKQVVGQRNAVKPII